MRDFRLPLRSSVMLRSVAWYLVTDASKQAVDHIYKGQETCLILECGINILSRNVGN